MRHGRSLNGERAGGVVAAGEYWKVCNQVKKSKMATIGIE